MFLCVTVLMTFIFIIIIKDADQNVKNKKSYKDNLTVFFLKKILMIHLFGKHRGQGFARCVQR